MKAAAAVIRNKVERGAEDRLWTFGDFVGVSPNAVAKTLGRLVAEGVIVRVRKGVYYRPKRTRFGETKPDPTATFAKALDCKGVVWMPSGLSAWNALGLTTQVPAVATLVVDRRVGVADPSGRVRLRRVPSVRGVTVEERAALDAMRELQHVPDTTPVEVIRRLADLCRSGRISFARLCRAAPLEPPRVRALVGLIGTILGEDAERLAKLRRTMNPATTFKLDIAHAFDGARAWGIR